MLNISNTPIANKPDLSRYQSIKSVTHKKYYKKLNKFLLIFLGILLITLFLPWTQTVSGTGFVTTLKPSQRPQTIQSALPGRIEQWYVQEGDYVHKNDTILRISEVKSEYFDQKLLQRTQEQIEAKQASQSSYESKTIALNNQIDAIKREQQLKNSQAKNKLEQEIFQRSSDSILFKTAELNFDIATRQYNRTKNLEAQGLKSRKELEMATLKLQESENKLNASENKFKSSQNKVVNAQLELKRLASSYREKISKAQSDLFSAESANYETQVQVSKLQNSASNYEKRSSLMYITAPQSGYINKAIKQGIGETFKEGESLLNIMPSDYDLAVEIFIKPIDLPLIHKGEKVRIQFDGWPAIVFSGWESVSYGTYAAKVNAVENFISPNGMYRVLLVPDPSQKDKTWPEAIRMGSGVKSFALLNNVPIWYEMWRQLNGFPPDFYTAKDQSKQTKK